MEDRRRRSGRKKAKRLPKELSRVNLNAAGIDLGASSHFVAVSEEHTEEPVREFEAYTAELYRMADWLVDCGVETVVSRAGQKHASGVLLLNDSVRSNRLPSEEHICRLRHSHCTATTGVSNNYQRPQRL